ncbi:MAG: hypothetical protein E5V74_07745 [Mesorhizobium sp.]|nr:MAG: hypothetical protein E5W02_22175 [Mesorhizobium sp.]TIW03990.1 MAG: hypothetical protein E5V74_07745 [Mesorhizobium sp.]
MTDSSEINTRLENLKKVRDTGVQTVKHGEALSTFRPLSEIEKIVGTLEQEKAAADGKSRKRVRLMFQSSKGL